MIPAETGFLEEDFEIEQEPSKNYRMDIKKQRVQGKTDGLEAMKQVVFKILSTERYQYLIYSWDYGIELLDLFGEPVSYVCPELEYRITEALQQDDRIEEVDGFEFEVNGSTVKALFTVHTVFGNLKAEREVDI
ncbi:hypothetical protein C805_00606 [Eubacterium sp. 14-2]|uniref:DUF2634 domain-containing protein n=1 Tax=Eubacterium sp. 14-2 TaxID=1235790 RepID=UPI000336EBCB|nr:DUF2634 domain-containing protein [Eubacterium sp. 14-2]EOT26514.1 hypothetical protein C805_00606 [Eubacterium sp. 14-2]